MIQVRKSSPPPAALGSAAVRAAQAALEAAYEADPAACHSPRSRRLRVPATLYNDPVVKQQLVADQHEKCCFCEARLLHVGYGDVEHYRPKNGFRQAPAAPLEKPGYYWLAYAWDNLLFSCQRCNQAHKRNCFPLANHPAGRARSHHDPVAREQPLLLHPAGDDPAAHIGFRGSVAIGRTERGRTTVELCGLNRAQLLERRRTHLAHLESHGSVADMDLATISAADLARELARCGGSRVELVRRIRQARTMRDEATSAAAEFAGMVRANFPPRPAV